MGNMEIRLTMFFVAKDGETIQSAKTRLWLKSWVPYCKIQAQMEEIGKTTRPFKYDLNQIPYDYTVEVTSRFKGLGLVARMPEVSWTEVYNTVQEAVMKTIPKKKKCKKAKWLSEECFQIAEERWEVKGKRKWKRYTQLNAELQGRARRDKKAFLNQQCRETEENNRKTRDLFRKIGDIKGTFCVSTGMIKDRKVTT